MRSAGGRYAPLEMLYMDTAAHANATATSVFVAAVMTVLHICGDAPAARSSGGATHANVTHSSEPPTK
jgi:hypothetical protein